MDDAVETQEEINNLFINYTQLKPQSLPPYCDEFNSDNPPGVITLDVEGTCTGTSYESWAMINNISIAEDNSLDTSNTYITRIDEEANALNNTDGVGFTGMKPLQALRDDVTEYLKDIDSEAQSIIVE